MSFRAMPVPVIIKRREADMRWPAARVRLPARVPSGFHGNWADAAALDRATAASRTAVSTARGEG